MVLVCLMPRITIGSHQQQADIDADLRQSVDALLEPVRARVARIEPPRKDTHADHPQRAQREEHTRRKAADPGQNRRAAQLRAARDQRRQQQKKADRHENPHLNEHGPDVPAGYGGDQLPKHLHDAGEQADERPGDKERTLKQPPHPDGGQAEKHDGDQIHQRHHHAEPLRNGILCHFVIFHGIIHPLIPQ